MNKQTIMGLTVVAVILSLAAYFAYQPTPEQFAPKLWLPDLANKIEQVDTIEVQKKGKGEVHLNQKDNGWRVKEKYDYPASLEKIRDLIGALQEAEIKAKKTADPNKHARLELTAEQATRIRMLSGNDVLLDVMVGKQGPNYQGRYVRLSDSNQTYWIDKNLDVSLDAVHWLDRDLISIEPAQVKRVTYQAQGAKKPLIVERHSPTDKHFSVRDLPQDRALAFEGAADVADTVLLGLRLEDVMPRPANTPQKPVFTTTVDTFDGKHVVIRMFEPKENELWAEFDVSFLPENIVQTQTSAPSDKPSDDQMEKWKNQANALATRLAPWRYKLSSYQSQVLRKKLEDFTRVKKEEKSSNEGSQAATPTKPASASRDG